MTQCIITAAPSKFDLCFAFFGGKYPHRLPVRFTIKIPNLHEEEKIDVIINQLTWEDGSGESWCFEGYVTCQEHIPSSLPEFKARSFVVHVKGYFKTTDRKGWVELTT
jgi:hypothetical protein